jgi:hypothetical protein
MIGFDFTGSNYAKAKHSLEAWARYATQSQQFDVVFGVSTANYRSKGMTGAPHLKTNDALKEMSKLCPAFARWDEDVTDIANKILDDGNGADCRPFYPGFNYGSLDNRLLLLANVISCRYLVRIDPGTCPPSAIAFDDVLSEHLRLIDSRSIVVSQGYKDRLAIRDMFVRDKSRHEQLILEYTGIEPTSQVTGGAMLTSNVPGVPALPFEPYGPDRKGNTLVWGSDDAIYQILDETRGSHKLSLAPIPRFDAEGKKKSTIEYYRGVTGMVYLSTLIEGHGSSEAESKLQKFFGKLKAEYLDPLKYRPEEEGKQLEEEFDLNTVAPAAFRKSIEAGRENHARLLSNDNWTRMSDQLGEALRSHVFIE